MLELDGELDDPPTELPKGRTTTLAPPRDLLALGAAVLLCVAFAPMFVMSAWSPRFVILLCLLPVGLVAIGSLVVARDAAAIAATAFVGVATLSAALSGNPRVSLLGQLGKESSALLLAAFFGCWAIGRRLGERGRALLPFALLLGLGVNAFAAILQVLTNSHAGEFGLQSGRAVGLTANPVQFGALMAGGAAICGVQALTTTSRRWFPWLAGVVVFSMAVDMSGTRIAVLSLAVVIVGEVLMHRSWRALAVVAAVVVGVLVSATVSEVKSTGGSSTTRVTDSFDRQSAWVYGLESFTERPLLGFGPGEFRAATQHRYSADFVRTAASNEVRQAWFDAHNLAVEYLVATGIVGLAVLAAFGWFALRTARGPLLAAFLAIAASWTMQPMAVSTAPVAMLALGGAAPALSALELRRPRLGRVGLAVAGVIGLLLGGFYAVADRRLDAAMAARDAPRVEAAASWFPADAVVADVVAQAWVDAYLDKKADEQPLLEWSRRTAAREPDRPLWWIRLGARQMVLGDPSGARTSLQHAVDLEPWSPTAWRLLLQLARDTSDTALEQTALDRVCTLRFDECDR